MAQGPDQPRASYASVDLSEEVELDDEGHDGAPPALFVSAELEVPVDAFSIDNLLALTGEHEGWGIEDHAKQLKKMASEQRKPVEPLGDAAPSILLPRAVDLGGKAATPRTDTSPVRKRPESMPPPPPRKRPAGPPAGEGSETRPGLAKGPPAPSPGTDGDVFGTLQELIGARISVLEPQNDTVGLTRAHGELSVVAELAGDDARAHLHADAALKLDSSMRVAHWMERLRCNGRTALRKMLGHLAKEIEVGGNDPLTTELLAERARLLDATGEAPHTVLAAWHEPLQRNPLHAGALKGLEGELWRDTGTTTPESFEALARHLARLADAYAAQPELAAWLHVERAKLLEKNLGRDDEARGALERAVALDPAVGPVRDAYTRFLGTEDDASTLIALYDEEARIEHVPARSARLELDAAILAFERNGDVSTATALLERAAARAPTTHAIDRRVLDELTEHYETLGRWEDVVRARRSRLEFLDDPAVRGYELRRLAALSEKLGDVASAIDFSLSVYEQEPTDDALRESIDRLFALAEQHPERIQLWLAASTHHQDPRHKARYLRRAAAIAHEIDEREAALRHLHTARSLCPDDAETVDMLARLMTPAPSETVDGESRALIDLYTKSALACSDRARKIAYLEKVALLWEDVIGEPRRAARIYEEILGIEPGRRGAMFGLFRSASRVGDSRGVARALLEEARLADALEDRLDLQVRAAKVLEVADRERALKLVDEVLTQDPAHDDARELEGRLLQDSGQYELAARSLRRRIEHTERTDKRASLYLALAQIEDVHLGQAEAALESLREARALDADHLAPPEEIARLLTRAGDAQALREALEDLARTAARPDERARFLVKAAEIEEFREASDIQAARLYVQALVESPDDELIAERLMRVLARKAKRAFVREPGSTRVPTVGLGERITLMSKRLERAGSPTLRTVLAFQLAELVAEQGQDLPRAVALLEEILAHSPGHIPALRTLEMLSRRQAAWPQLARVLSLQGDALLDARARLGALWSLAAIQQWQVSGSHTYETYERILGLDPTDYGALEAVARQKLQPARDGDPAARGAVLSALRAFAAVAYEDSTRVVLEVQLGLMLDRWGSGSPELMREALERFSAACTIDPTSVGAAVSLARLSTLLGDQAAAVQAATALAELSRPEPKTRARYLFDAASLLLGTPDSEALGSVGQRRQRADRLLEDALATDPDNLAVAETLSQLRQESGSFSSLIDVFREALVHARSREAVVLLGTDIATVARDRVGNLALAVEAMNRVRQAAPDHAASLLMLAELYITQRNWPDAIEVLETVAALPDDTPSRLTALFALARIYEKIVVKLADAERTLRLALSLDPESPRALRALVHRLASKSTEARNDDDRVDHRAEMADLLETLADVETDPAVKSEVFLELAELRQALGELSASERALVEAAAHDPSNDLPIVRLRRFFGMAPDQAAGSQDAASYARALNAVLARGRELGRGEAGWLAELGNVEIDKLGRVRDGINHLTQAIRANRELFEARFQLANALARIGSNDEASKTLHEMIVPEARPLLSIASPASALDLLERIMGAERRPEEAIAVSELRAIVGDLDEGRHQWLRGRELSTFENHHSAIDRQTLLAHAAPREAGHVLFEVAAAIAGTESKMLRSDLTEVGISSRDRIGSRSGHPTRQMVDRLSRALGLSGVELVVTPAVTRTRVFVQDEPWIVVPRRLTELPEQSQIASLARALAKIALAVPWLEELPPPHIEAYLLAAARQGLPHYGDDDIDVISKRVVSQYEPAVAKALSRKAKRALEELTPRLSMHENRPMLIDDFMALVARCELRIAYVLTGDLLSTIDELRALDASFLQQTETPGVIALRAVLEHRYAGDVARFALTREATALRRRVGSTWTG